MNTIFSLIKDTFKDWQDDEAPRLAAALSYYTVFSLAPLLVIAIAVAGLIFGQDATQQQIVSQVDSLVGPDAAETIGTLIENSSEPSTGILATVIGVATLIFGATGVFGELHNSLNKIWEVRRKEGGGVLRLLKDRFLSFTMVLGIGFLLLISLVVSAGLAAVNELATGMLPGMEVVLQIASFAISFGVITLLFAAIFKVLPDVDIAWKDVWVGAAVTALLFTIGKQLIGLYLGQSTVASTYGAAGSLIVILVWVYYSAQIMFLGAEFTQVYATRFGSKIVPEEHAVIVGEGLAGKPSKKTAQRPAHAIIRGVRPGTVPVDRRLSVEHEPVGGRSGGGFFAGLLALFGMIALAVGLPRKRKNR